MSIIESRSKSIHAQFLLYITLRFGSVRTEVGSIFIERRDEGVWKNECGFKNQGMGPVPSVADCFATKKSFFVDHDKYYCKQHSDKAKGNVLGVVCDNTI